MLEETTTTTKQQLGKSLSQLKLRINIENIIVRTETYCLDGIIDDNVIIIDEIHFFVTLSKI